MTRMKKMTMKKSSLRGSELAWVPKADCTDFMVRVNRFGPILPPLVGSLVHGVPVPFFSLSEETVKAQRPWLTADPPIPNPLLFFSSAERVDRLFWKSPAIPCRFYTDLWPRSQSTPPTSVFCLPSSDFLWNWFIITTISSVLTN